MTGKFRSRWQAVFCGVVLLTSAGCGVRVLDGQGRTVFGSPTESADVKSAQRFSQMPPTDERLKTLTALLSATQPAKSCDGSIDSFVHAYRSIELERYRFNRFAVKEAQAEAARAFLVDCIAHGPEDLVGLSMLGLGYHGSKDDAAVITGRLDMDGSETLIPSAAMGLTYVCDPIAEANLKLLSTRATDERARDTVRTSLVNRAAICRGPTTSRSP